MAQEFGTGLLKGFGDSLVASNARDLAQQNMQLEKIAAAKNQLEVNKLLKKLEAQGKFSELANQGTDPRAPAQQVGNVPTPFLAAGQEAGATAKLPEILAQMNVADKLPLFGGDMGKMLEASQRQSPEQFMALLPGMLGKQVSGVVQGAKPDFDLNNPPQFNPAGAQQTPAVGGGFQGGALPEGVSIELTNDGNVKYTNKGVESTDEIKFLNDLGMDKDSPEGKEMLLRLKGVGDNAKQLEVVQLETARLDKKQKVAELAKFEREEKEEIAKGKTVKARFQRRVTTNLTGYKRVFDIMEEIERRTGITGAGGFSKSQEFVLKGQRAGQVLFGRDSKKATENLNLFQKYKIASDNISATNALRILTEKGQKGAPLAEFRALTAGGLNPDNDLAANYQALADLFQGTLDIVETNDDVDLNDESIKELKGLIKKANKKSNELAGIGDPSKLFGGGLSSSQLESVGMDQTTFEQFQLNQPEKAARMIELLNKKGI